MNIFLFKAKLATIHSCEAMERLLSNFDFLTNYFLSDQNTINKDVNLYQKDVNLYLMTQLISKKIKKIANKDSTSLDDLLLMLGSIPKDPNINYNMNKSRIENDLGGHIVNKLFDEIPYITSYRECIDRISYVAEKTSGYKVSQGFVYTIRLAYIRKLTTKSDSEIVDDLLAALKEVMSEKDLLNASLLLESTKKDRD